MRPSLTRPFALVLGLLSTGLGLVGVLVPLMPSTIFFILAAACFAYASPKLERWLLSFKFIGEPVRAWRERGAIERRAKIAASLGMSLGLLLIIVSEAGPIAIAGAAVFLGLCAAFVWTRPE